MFEVVDVSEFDCLLLFVKFDAPRVPESSSLGEVEEDPCHQHKPACHQLRSTRRDNDTDFKQKPSTGRC